MELRQLRYFVAVAEEGSFTVAARRLHVAQPGVSAQVRKLEEELGSSLFDRSDRAVRLTAAGAAVLAEARAAIAAAGAAQGAVDALVGLKRGRVTIGSVPSCPVADLPELLAEFHREFPEIEISLGEGNGEDLMRVRSRPGGSTSRWSGPPGGGRIDSTASSSPTSRWSLPRRPGIHLPP